MEELSEAGISIVVYQKTYATGFQQGKGIYGKGEEGEGKLGKYMSNKEEGIIQKQMIFLKSFDEVEVDRKLRLPG